MFKKLFILVMGIIMIGIMLFTVLVSMFTYDLYKEINLKIKTLTPTPMPENNFSENRAEIDSAIDLDLKLFAPFYFWEKTGENKVLARFEKDGRVTQFPAYNLTNGQTNQAFTVSPDKKKLLFVEDKTTVGIFDTDTDRLQKAEIKTQFGYGNLALGSWSPNGDYAYVLFSSDTETDHNFWVINTKTMETSKLFNGYSIKLIGWVDNQSLAFYEGAVTTSSDKLVIKAFNVRDRSVRSIGFCNDLWVEMCNGASAWNLKDNKMFYSNVNKSEVYIYDYQDQSDLRLFDILSETEFAKTHITALSPHKYYLFLNIFVSFVNKQPEKAGMYEYNLVGRYWRHIAKKDLRAIYWSENDRFVLLKEDNTKNYFFHEMNTYDVHPVIIPPNIAGFI